MYPAVGNMLCCKGISQKNVARLFSYRVRRVYKWSQEEQVARTRRSFSLVEFRGCSDTLASADYVPLEDRVFTLSYQC